MASIAAVCISPQKGTVKKEVAQVDLAADWGISGDAHAGDWHRQVSLLAEESIAQVRKKLSNLANGAFAENFIVRGLDFTRVEVGDTLVIDNRVRLKITQIGKECHNHKCAIKRATGDCIMPKEGLFAEVLQGGTVAKGHGIELQKAGESGT